MTALSETHAAGDPRARERVEELLAEVNALAVRLKWGPRGAAAGELPAATRAVLHLLKREGRMAVPALARARGTSRQNIQTIINRLQRAGLVAVAGNPAHKRSDLVFLTESGAAMLESGAAREAELLDALAAAAPEADVVSACEVVRRLREALGAVPAAEGAPRPKAQSGATAAQDAETDAGDHELPLNLL